LIFDCARRLSFVDPRLRGEAAGRGISEPSDRAMLFVCAIRLAFREPAGWRIPAQKSRTEIPPGYRSVFDCAMRLRFAEPAGWRVAHGQNQIGPTTAHPRERQLYGR